MPRVRMSVLSKPKKTPIPILAVPFSVNYKAVSVEYLTCTIPVNL